MRENAASKAKRYLTEGRVVITQVVPGRVDAIVRGDGSIHAAGYRSGTWACSCPARTADCSHLRALRLTTAVDLPDCLGSGTSVTSLPAPRLAEAPQVGVGPGPPQDTTQQQHDRRQ